MGRQRKRWRDHFILKIREQETRLILHEHDDDDNDDDDDNKYKNVLSKIKLEIKIFGKPREYSENLESIF